MVTVRRMFPPSERPEIEVLVGDVWRRGRLSMWIHHEDDSTSAQVDYRSHRGSEPQIVTVLASQVRPVEDSSESPADPAA